MTSHCPNWCSQLKNFLPCQPDRINNWTIQIFKDFTSGVEVVIMVRRKKERSKQNFILIMNHPLISSVGSNGVSKYLEDIRFWNEFWIQSYYWGWRKIKYRKLFIFSHRFGETTPLVQHSKEAEEIYNLEVPDRKFRKRSTDSSWLTLHRMIDKTSAVPHTSVLGYYAHFLHLKKHNS